METNIRSAFVSNSVSFQHNMYSINPPHIIKHNVSSSYFINMKVKTCDAFIKLIKEPANLNDAFCYSTWLEINVLTRHEISRLHNISNLILHYIIYFPAAIFYICIVIFYTDIHYFVKMLSSSSLHATLPLPGSLWNTFEMFVCPFSRQPALCCIVNILQIQHLLWCYMEERKS